MRTVNLNFQLCVKVNKLSVSEFDLIGKLNLNLELEFYLDTFYHYLRSEQRFQYIDELSSLVIEFGEFKKQFE